MSKITLIFAIFAIIVINKTQCCFLPPSALGCGVPAAPALGCLPPPPPCALPPPPPPCALPAAPALGCAPPPLTILPMPMPAAPIFAPPKLPLLLKKLFLPKLLGLSALGGCGLPSLPLGCAC